MLKELLLKNRSYRRFDESFEIKSEELRELVELARLTPSSVNWQPLRFVLVNDNETNAKVFDGLREITMENEWVIPMSGVVFILTLGEE